MTNDLPDIVKEVGFDFDWDNDKVWNLDLPVRDMDIRELVWHFDVPFHNHEGKPYCLTSWEIMKNPERYKEEYKRTLKADIRYPIDIMENKDHWLILDGLHRLMKLHLQGVKTVKVRVVPREKIGEILRSAG